MLAGTVTALVAAGAAVATPRGDMAATVRTDLVQSPTGVTVDPRAGLAYVITLPFAGINRKGGVSVLDMRTARVLWQATLGLNPVALVLDGATDRAFVINNGDSSMSVLSLRHRGIAGTLPIGNAPQGLAIDGSARRAFVSWSSPGGGGHLSMFDTRTGRLLRTVGAAGAPGKLVVDGRHHRVVVIDEPTRAMGHVSVYDSRDGRLLRTVALGWTTRAVAVSERGGTAIVAGYGRDGRGIVSLIDTTTGGVHGRGIVVARYLWAAAIDDGGERAFVSDPVDGSVSGIDAAGGRVLWTTRTGAGAEALAVDARRAVVAVANAGTTDATGRFSGGGSIGIIDARTGRLERAMVTTSNPLDVAIDRERGRVVVAAYAGTARPAAGESPVQLLLHLIPWIRRPSAASARGGDVTSLSLDR